MGDKPTTLAEIIKQDDETLARMRKQSEEQIEARIASAVALAVASTNLRHKEIIEASPTYRNHTGQPKLCWCDMCAYVRGNVTEINATTLADAQAALARFKADAVREARLDEAEKWCSWLEQHGEADRLSPWQIARLKELGGNTDIRAALQPPSGAKP